MSDTTNEARIDDLSKLVSIIYKTIGQHTEIVEKLTIRLIRVERKMIEHGISLEEK